jgi:hypothetical protein
MVIGETASTEYGGSKATWITDALSTELLLLFPQVNAFLWFDKGDSSYGWPIESSKSAIAAFAAAVSAAAYAPNQFAALDGGSIQPLP